MKLSRTRIAKSLLGLFIVLIQACSSTTSEPTQPTVTFDPRDASIDELVQAANNADGIESAELRVLALEALIEDGNFDRASRQSALLSGIGSYPENLQLRASLLQAQLALNEGQPAEALQILSSTSVADLESRPGLLHEYLLILGRAYQAEEQYESALSAYLQLGSTGANNSDPMLFDEIWNGISLGDVQFNPESVLSKMSICPSTSRCKSIFVPS